MYAVMSFLLLCFTDLGARTPLACRPAKVMMGLGLVYLLFCITACRLHYTCDVVVAAVLTTSLVANFREKFMV